MIDKIGHYAIENQATVYDEESLTALQLAGRTAAKVNEAVDAFNKLETETNETITQQNEAIETLINETVPNTIADDVNDHIQKGDFDRAINEYAGDLENRLNNLLGQTVAGGTTADAEIVDARTLRNGTSFENIGLVMRDNAFGSDSVDESSGIAENVNLALTAGAFINRNGGITEHSDQNWVYSVPIDVPAGRHVILYASGSETNVAMISREWNRGDQLYREVIAKSRITGLDYYEFVTKKPERLVFSFNKGRGYSLKIAAVGVGQTTETVGKWWDALRNAGKWYDPELILNVGQYLNGRGEILAHTDYCMSAPIDVPAGYTVIVDAYGYTTNVGIINRLNADGTYSCLVRSRANENGESDYLRYYYTTQAKTRLVFSFSALDNHPPRVSVIYTGAGLKAADMVSLSVFRRFGVVGDSYASGAMYNGDYILDYATSWGQIMAREYGTVCENYSRGGLTTRTWLTASEGLNKLKTTDPCDIYYLALGINDSNNLGVDYIGSSSDVSLSNYSANADTYFGNYSRIISEIKKHAPKAKIVLFTLRENSDVRAAYNEAIKEIAALHGVPYIVQDDDEFFTSSFYNDTMDQGHPIAVTYSGMAKGYARLIADCVVNNVAYFANLYEN